MTPIRRDFMKKTFTIFLVLILLINYNNFIPLTLASETANEKTIKDVLLEQANATIDPAVYNRTLYHENLRDYVLIDKPIVRRCYSTYWDFFANPEKSVEDILEYADGKKVCDYLVFDEEIFMIYKSKEEDNIVIGLYKGLFDENAYGLPLEKGKYPQYVLDIRMGSATHEINGEDHIITNVFCFDGTTSYDGIIVYYVTNKGDYVTWYADNYSQGVDFLASEFREYAALYYAELIAYENNYNEKGEPLAGGKISFLDFVNKLQNEGSVNNDVFDEPWKWHIWICPGILLLMIASGFVVWKLKKKY